MGSKCPHCSEEITSLAGFVTDETLRERLARKQTSHEAAMAKAEAKATDLEGKLKAFEGVDIDKTQKRLAKAIERADSLESEFAAYKTKTERDLVWANASITDPDVQDAVLYRYGKLPEESRPALSAYLDGAAKEDKFLAPLLGSASSSSDSESSAGESGSGASGTFQTFDPNAGVTQGQQEAGGNKLRAIHQATSYDQRVKLAGSHEALEKMLGYPIMRPKSRS